MLGQTGTKRALTEVSASQTVNTVAEKDVQIPIYQATAGDVQRLGTGRRVVRILVALTIAGGMGVLAAWGIIEGRSQAAREAERAGPVQVPSRVKLDDGGDPAVILDERTRKRSGVEVAYTLRPEGVHNTAWWPEVKDSFERFVREHPRQPYADKLT